MADANPEEDEAHLELPMDKQRSGVADFSQYKKATEIIDSNAIKTKFIT